MKIDGEGVEPEISPARPHAAAHARRRGRYRRHRPAAEPEGRVETALDALNFRPRGMTVLDYGCGNGYQIEALAKLGASHAHGVDLAAGRIEHARRRLSGLANA